MKVPALWEFSFLIKRTAEDAKTATTRITFAAYNMQRSIALALLLAIALAPSITSAARKSNQWRTRRGRSGFGGFQRPSSSGSSPSTTSSSPSTTTSSPSTTTSPTTTTTSPTTTTTSPTTTTTSPTTATTSPTSSPTSSSSGPSSSVLNDVLSLHNSLRSKHSTSLLTWSSYLASSAQSWSVNCNFAHSGTRGVGENIAMGYRTFTDAVNAWYSEVSQYDFSNPGYSSSTGHFTQIVWKGTTQLGCGYTQCGSSGTLYVFQYSPQGNMIGEFPANVS